MMFSLSKSIFTKSYTHSLPNDKYSIRLLYKLESEDSEDVWICSYRNHSDLTYKYFDSNFTVPSHLKFAGFLVFGNSKFDVSNLESLGLDVSSLEEFYFLTLENDFGDFSSLTESFLCFKVYTQSGKQSNLSIPLENIRWVEDDDLELKNRNLFLMNVSLLLFSKLPFTYESESNPFKNGFNTVVKLPHFLNNEIVNALKAHSANLDSEETTCSVTYSDSFEPIKDAYSQFYVNYTLGFGFDCRGRKHALLISGEYEDYCVCLRLLLQTNFAIRLDQLEDDDFNKLVLTKANEQLIKLINTLEKDSSFLCCYVLNDHNKDDKFLFMHEQDEENNKSECKESRLNRSSGKKSSGKGKGGKNTQKSPQTPKKPPVKKTVFNFLPSLEFFGSAYSLNFDPKTGGLSLLPNKNNNDHNENNNKTSVNLVYKFIMTSTSSSQYPVPNGGVSVALFDYLSESEFIFDGLLEDNEDFSRLKFVFNPYEVVDRTILISPHQFGNSCPPWISPKKSSVSMVNGNYQYYHYTQCGVNDTGWGCCYRSLQLVCSWYLLQYLTPKLVPSHSVIQQVLKENDVSHKDLKIGSSTWIGTVESGYFLNWFLGYTYKTLYLNDVSEFRNYNVVIADHFKSEGTPVIVGAGSYAYVILGICLDNEGGEVAYLIADPHYTGDDSVKNVLSKGGIGWKKIEFLSKASDGRFINLCLPQLEKYCV